MLAKVWRIGWSTWDGWRRHNGALLSAAMADYGAFSLFPLCLVLIAGVGFVGRYSAFVQAEQHRLVERVAENVSPWLAGELESILAGVQSRALLGGPVGLLFLLMAAIGIFMQLENVFARVWSKTPAADTSWPAAIREALWDRLAAFLTLLTIGALIIVIFITDAVMAGMRSRVTDLPSGAALWRILHGAVSILCNALLLSTLYYALPKARVRWRAALGGGLLAAAIWAVGRWLLLMLLVSKPYGAYGVLGALMGVMFWYYFASAVVVLGAEFVRALSEECSEERA